MIEAARIDATIDKRRVAQQFSKAALSYTHHDQLQRLCAEQLFAKLEASENVADSVLVDLGCGPGHHAEHLRDYCQIYLGLDIAEGMLARAHAVTKLGGFVGADFEQLPLQPESTDRIFANLSLQWAQDAQAALQQCVQILKPGGQMVFSTVLAGSMYPLAQCFSAIDGQRHTNDWLTFAELVAALPEANMRWRYHEQTFEIAYQDVLTMLRDLKGIGANYTVRKPLGMFGRRRLNQLIEKMEEYKTGPAHKLRWNIGFVDGMKLSK